MTTPGADNVHVEVTGGVAGLNAAMREAATSVEEGTAEITGALEGMAATVEAAFAPLLALMAVFESFEFIKDAVEQTAEFGKQLEITSQKTGMAADQLSALQYAANLSDVTVEELTIGLQRLSRNMETVAKGGKGPAADALAALGIRATEANGQLKPLHDILLELAARFERMEDGAGKTALAIDLFGRSGANLIPLLNQGASGIEDLERKAKELGVTMGEDGVDKANAYVDAMKEFNAVWDAAKRELALEIIPTLTILAGWLEKVVEHWKNVWTYVKLLNPELIVLTALWDHLAKIDPSKALLADPALVHALGLDKKTPAPLPKDTSKGPSHLELLREEWNKRKQIAIDGDEDILAVEIDFWKKKLALETEGTKDYIEIHTHLLDLEEQFAKKKTALDKKTASEWKSTFEEAPKAFANALEFMQQSAGGFRDFMREIWYELVAMSAKAGFDMLATYAAQELTKRGITRAGALETIAIKTWEGLKWIAIEAAKAAASVWAAVSAMPGGAFIAPVLAIATLAGVLALAGTFSGGGSAPSGGAGSGGGGNGASANRAAPMVVHIHAIDSRSFADFARRNPEGFVAGVSAAVKNGSLTAKKLGLA